MAMVQECTGWPSDVLPNIEDQVSIIADLDELDLFYIGRTNDLDEALFNHDCDEVFPPVIVDVGGDHLVHHAEILEFRRDPRSHVAKAAVHILVDQRGLMQGILLGFDPVAHDEIEVSVLVIVDFGDALAADRIGIDIRRRKPGEIAFSVVQVDPVN